MHLRHGQRNSPDLRTQPVGCWCDDALHPGHRPDGFLLNTLVENVGRFFWTLPERLTETMGYQLDGAEWMSGNTLFFWAFWLAWGPFVGLFLARISRGRTLREFVIAAITIPVLCDLVMVSLFGNSAIFEAVFKNNTEFADLALESPEQGWYALLEMFPGAMLLVGLATLSGLLFYLTSANSGGGEVGHDHRTGVGYLVGSAVLPDFCQLRCDGHVQLLLLHSGSWRRRTKVAAHLLGHSHRSINYCYAHGRWRS